MSAPNETTYETWTEFHVMSLGIPGDVSPRNVETWTKTIDGWLETFIAAGYTAEELTEATKILITSTTPPRFVSEHLAGLNGCVRAKRAVRQRQQQPNSEPEYSTCVLCGNSGFAIVPHLSGVKGDRWEWTKPYHKHLTCAVLCNCAKGRRLAQADHPAMTLERYQEYNPNWRSQVELVKAEKKLASQIGQNAPDLRFTEALNEILKRHLDAEDPPSPQSEVPF